MNRLLTVLRGAAAPPAADVQLLDEFVRTGDEAAFAELVRRLGPVVWGACRRALAHAQDAEDAFQATFLVLLRRAGRFDPGAPLGPWLYKVATLTARNLRRGNRRRARVSGPLEVEVPTTAPDPGAALDLDAALLALPEGERAAVVLCHLQGHTRREAAERLGCPEGTLSARLNRALARLRSKLGAGAPAALAVTATLPPGLAQATVRSATIYSTSALAGAVPPVVAQLTDGVLRMFWMKKVLTAAVAVFVLGAGALALALADRAGGAARATEPRVPEAATPEEPDPKSIDMRLADLEKQKADVEAMLNDLKRARQKLDEHAQAKAAVAELGDSLAIVVTEGGRGLGWSKPPYTVREVVNGKIGEMQCYELDILERYLARAAADPKGPKAIRFYVDTNFSHDQIYKLFAVCAKAGFKKGRFILPEAPLITTLDRAGKPVKAEYGKKEKDIDLTTYAETKKQP